MTYLALFVAGWLIGKYRPVGRALWLVGEFRQHLRNGACWRYRPGQWRERRYQGAIVLAQWCTRCDITPSDHRISPRRLARICGLVKD